MDSPTVLALATSADRHFYSTHILCTSHTNNYVWPSSVPFCNLADKYRRGGLHSPALAPATSADRHFYSTHNLCVSNNGNNYF